MATFAQGPCPALKSVTQRKRRETVEVPKPKLRLSPSGILSLIARIGAKMRYPYFVESNLHPPDGITLRIAVLRRKGSTMNKHSLTETLSRGEKHRQFFDTSAFPQLEYPEGEVLACSVAYLLPAL